MTRLEYPDPIDTVDHHGTSKAVGIGPLLYAVVRPDEPRRVMVAGHADTVFGPDHRFQEVRRDGELLHGPGVADMKGGLVALLAALEVILERDLAPDLGIDVVISGDEEIGSPSSIPTMNAVGRRACAALVVEPRMVGGGVARARAGSANLTFVVTGRSAHAGRALRDGRNAVVAAADLVGRVNGDTRRHRSVSISPRSTEGMPSTRCPTGRPCG